MSPVTPAAPLDLDRLRRALVAAGRRLGARGLISAGEGNVSVRLDAETLLFTPSGRRKDELAPDDMIEAGLTSVADAWPAAPYGSAGLRPSSDIAIHRAIYAARSDVLAVVHAHLPASMALTLAGETPDPAVLPETALLIPRVPLVPFGQPGINEAQEPLRDAKDLACPVHLRAPDLGQAGAHLRPLHRRVEDVATLAAGPRGDEDLHALTGVPRHRRGTLA